MSSSVNKREQIDSAQCSEGTWSINYVSGDLFSCPPDESLAHCISEDCRMGAGIAVMFKNEFGGVEELKGQRKHVGQCAVLERGGRFVYYLITKKIYKHKPTYKSVKQSLEDMKSHCVMNKVSKVSMPRIGCGRDKLNWTRISETLKEVLEPSNISITVYSLPEKTKTPVMRENPHQELPATLPPAAQCSEGTWSINYVSGDLFSCPLDESLAHCISEDCRMGAGIAVMFKKKFGGVEDLKGQKKQVGQCAVLKRGSRFVYYLITKKIYNHKPTYDSLKQSLEDMKSHCLINAVSKVSMPRIGCGLDRLEWKRVSEILKEVFEHSDISVTVYSLEAVPTAQQTKQLA
ncbi:hypothetical protein NL108_006440 [Boleophthalmus pectinirostris]|nr:ADP-ribose glycohydrolase OARD1 isoform X2 [Boleophthalmus pectinirostris]KAJ0044052.1 hypothetical protein NL108_006440 [Boleophthalmus pectinirostris]